MEVSPDFAGIYQSLAQLMWEIPNGPTTKTVDGNIVYVVKGKGPAGQVVERQARSAMGALASLLHYAQRSNKIRGAALLPTEVQIPGVISGKKPFKIGETDPNAQWNSGEAHPDKDFARATAPPEQRFPENLYNHVQETAKSIDTGWYLSAEPKVWENAVMNAFRIALLSPRKDFSWNAIHYQDVADLPHTATANDYFHRLENRRRAWNTVTKGEQYGHARYAKQLKRLSKRILEMYPDLDPKDAEGVAFDVLGNILKHSETAFIAAMQRNPKKYDADSGKWIDPPTSLQVYSRGLDLVNDQLAATLDKKAANRLAFAGLTQIGNIDDYIHEAKSAFQPGSRHTDLTEADLDHARNATKHMPKSGYGAFIYGHLQAIQNASEHIPALAKAAHDDVVKHNGAGHHFRNKALSLGIKGMNSKVCSFAWLLLCPRTSQLGTMDTHMTRFLSGSEATNTFIPGIDDAAAGKPLTYYAFERMLKAVRDDLGYSQLPLGQFQWVIWDFVRRGDDPEDVGSEHRAISVDPAQWKPVADVKWPQTATRRSDPRWHPPEWMKPAMAARVKALYDYMVEHGGNGLSNHPDPENPKGLKSPFDYLNLASKTQGKSTKPKMTEDGEEIPYVPPVALDADMVAGGYQQHPTVKRPGLPPIYAEPPMAQTASIDEDEIPFGVYEEDLWNDWNQATERDNGGPPTEWEVYEGEDDELHHTPAGLVEPMRKRRPSEGEDYGRDAYSKKVSRKFIASQAVDTVEEKKFVKNALRGYDDAKREDRESKVFASSRTYEAQRVGTYPSSYDLIHIAAALGNNYDLEGYDSAVEDMMTNHRLANLANPFTIAASMMRAIQKHTGDDATAMVAGLMYLEDNGHEHAMEGVDDLHLAHMIQAMKTADMTPNDVASQLQTELEDHETVPNFRFVFYKGVLNIQDYHHNLGFQDLLGEILADHNKDLSDDNVQDDEMASGDITTRDGELDIELKSLADNSVNEHALNAIHEWAEGINLIGDIGVDKTAAGNAMDFRPATGRDMVTMPPEKILRIDNPLSDLHGTAWVVDEHRMEDDEELHHISSFQIEAATPEEVIEMIATTDLAPGSKWDLANPLLRDRILDALKIAAHENPNSRMLFRYLTSHFKKALPEWKDNENDLSWQLTRGLNATRRLAEIIPKLKANNVKFDINQYGSPTLAMQDAEAAVADIEKTERLKNDPWDSPAIHTTSNGYHVYPITTHEDLAREGDLMEHCIGGYNDELDRGNKFYSIRDKKGLPHASMHTTPDGEPLEFFGRSNHEPKEDYKAAMREFAQDTGHLRYDGNDWGHMRDDPEDEYQVPHPDPNDPYVDEHIIYEFGHPPGADDHEDIHEWMKKHDYGRWLPEYAFDDDQEPHYDDEIGHTVSATLEPTDEYQMDEEKDNILQQLDEHPIKDINNQHPDWQSWVHQLGNLGHLNWLQNRHYNWAPAYKNQHLKFLEPLEEYEEFPTPQQQQLFPGGGGIRQPGHTPQQRQLLQESVARAKKLQNHAENGMYHNYPGAQPQLPAPGGDPYGRGGVDWEVYNTDRAPGAVPGAEAYNRNVITSLQIESATLQEVLKLVFDTDLAEGTKFDKSNPGAREKIQEALMTIGGMDERSKIHMRWLASQLKKRLSAGRPLSDYDIQYMGHDMARILDAQELFKKYNIKFDINKYNDTSQAANAAADLRFDIDAKEKLKNSPWDAEPIHTTSGGHTIYPITTSQDLEREGELMGHCIGGYYEQLDRGNKFFSVRDKHGLPHASMHASPEGHVLEFFGRSNHEPKEEYKEAMQEFSSSTGHIDYDGYDWGHISDDDGNVPYPDENDPMQDEWLHEEYGSPPKPHEELRLSEWLHNHDYGRYMPVAAFDEDQEVYYDEDYGHRQTVPLDKIDTDTHKWDYLEAVGRDPQTYSPGGGHWNDMVAHLADLAHIERLQEGHDMAEAYLDDQWAEGSRQEQLLADARERYNALGQKHSVPTFIPPARAKPENEIGHQFAIQPPDHFVENDWYIQNPSPHAFQ